MSADRTVSVGEYGHSKVRCDGFKNGLRCTDSVTGAFRKGVKGARAAAEDRGWQVGIRTQYAPNGFEIRDYCPQHTRCHCGRPVAFGFDGNPDHHRGMCSGCDSVRCDAYPLDCPYR